MNRRNFLGSIVKAFTILPAATTYARRWTTLGSLVVPEYSCVMSNVTPVSTLTSEQFYEVLDTLYSIKRSRGKVDEIELHIFGDTPEDARNKAERFMVNMCAAHLPFERP